MGSIWRDEGKARRNRYFQADVEAPAEARPEGIEVACPTRPAARVDLSLVGGLRASMGYLGCATIATSRQGAVVKISSAGLRESHVHDVIITKKLLTTASNRLTMAHQLILVLDFGSQFTQLIARRIASSRSTARFIRAPSG